MRRVFKDPSSNPGAHKKKPGMVTCVCNHRTGDTETGGSLGLTGQPAGLLGESQITKVDGYLRNNILKVVLWYPQSHAHAHTHTLQPFQTGVGLKHPT